MGAPKDPQPFGSVWNFSRFLIWQTEGLNYDEIARFRLGNVAEFCRKNIGKTVA